jgi:hypothetical protein
MTLLTHIIMGDFKWTALGAMLVLLALFLAWLVGRKWKAGWRFFVGLVLVCTFVYYGHELIDPKIHAFEQWYCCSHPWGEPMQLDTSKIDK